MTVGYAFVVADLLHYGHLHFLRECKKHCSFLIVGVYTDELTATYKRKPIIPLCERLELIRALKIVDKVVTVHNRSCVPMLKKLALQGYKINVLFHGTDWNPDTDLDLKESKLYIESLGGKLVQPAYYKNQTTTGIIREIVRRYNNNEKGIP